MLQFIKIGFLEIGVGDILDIIVVAILIYQLYKLLRGSLAFNIFIGLLLVYLMSFIVKSLEMNVLANILGQFIEAGFILLVIVFQQEIRRFLFVIGRGSGIGKNRFWKRLLNFRNHTMTDKQRIIEEMAKAMARMSATHTGALMVFTDPEERAFFEKTGVRINGDITGKLLESIFDKNVPLHDGAVVITENKILAAGCILPVSENPDLPKRVGTRHRAAVGITEHIDAQVLIISEETGVISYASKGKLRYNISQTDLLSILDKALDDM